MVIGWRDSEAGAGRRAGAATVLPIVRAAMARGEGPPAVLAWVRRQGGARASAPDWSKGDEARARVLAARLAASLAGWGRAGAETRHLGATTDVPGDAR